MPDVVGMYRAAGVQLRTSAAPWVTCRCFNPAHDDRHASARVNLETGGFRCFGCDAKGGAIAALELLGVDHRRAVELARDYGVLDTQRPPVPRPRRSWQFLPPPPMSTVATTPASTPVANTQTAAASVVDWDTVTTAATAPTLERAWVYHDERGVPVGRVRRLDLPDGSKRIYQERPDREQWVAGLAGAKLPLYRLPDLREHARNGERVLVVEGEKIADALDRLAVFSTTNAGGTGKWRGELTEQLRGAHVTVAADCDWPGRAHAADVTRALVDAHVRATMPLELDPNRDDGYDLVDDLAELAATLRAVEPGIEPGELRRRLRRNLLDRVHALLPADPVELDRHLERFRRDSVATGFDTLVYCERCRDVRPHLIRAGLAYCRCGTRPTVAP